MRRGPDVVRKTPDAADDDAQAVEGEGGKHGKHADDHDDHDDEEDEEDEEDDDGALPSICARVRERAWRHCHAQFAVLFCLSCAWCLNLTAIACALTSVCVRAPRPGQDHRGVVSVVN